MPVLLYRNKVSGVEDTDKIVNYIYVLHVTAVYLSDVRTCQHIMVV